MPPPPDPGDGWPVLPPAPPASSPAVRASMQGNRRRDTRPELAVRRACHALGLRYRVDAPLPLEGVRRRADLVFARARVAVFVDGCRWHGCPEHSREPRTNADYWTAKLERNRRRDADTDARLAAAGWVALRAWEHEDPAVVAERVRGTVGSRRVAVSDG
ncbi:very short patch repair endonuclease [Motilibacter aurantiacus]|uniref:very short patch repair endonuclease n=1 Tax=Motilibacter aurantiacus TaxID=2714955 RepID=UPI002F2B576E